MGDSHVGLQARLMSQALRKLAGTLNRTDTICIFTNQLREKIGVMFGNPETTPGGRALKFYSSVRLDIRRIETLKDGAEAFGNRVRVKVVKNKVAPPFKQAEFDIIYGLGIPWEGTVLDVGLETKVVQKAGSYFSFGDERLGQGRQNATSFLSENPDLVQQILGRIQAEAPEEQVISARLLPTQAPQARRSSRSTSRKRFPSRAEPALDGADAAVEAALRLLRHRDRSAAQIDPRARRRAVSRRRPARRHSRLSCGRGSSTTLASPSVAPSTLADRGAGDAFIRHDLEAAGIAQDVAEDALAALEGEHERARRIVERRGASPKTARYLAGKGFSTTSSTRRLRAQATSR